MAMSFGSAAFASGTTIPRVHTCDGGNVAPPLEWADVPDGAVTLLITCDDPDAPRGTFHHWAIFNIPASATDLAHGIGTEAVNDFGRPGYGGPCPPHGDRPHCYVFRLAALKGRIDAPPNVWATEIHHLAKPLEIDAVTFTGLFGR